MRYYSVHVSPSHLTHANETGQSQFVENGHTCASHIRAMRVPLTISGRPRTQVSVQKKILNRILTKLTLINGNTAPKKKNFFYQFQMVKKIWDKCTNTLQ